MQTLNWLFPNNLTLQIPFIFMQSNLHAGPDPKIF